MNLRNWHIFILVIQLNIIILHKEQNLKEQLLLMPSFKRPIQCKMRSGLIWEWAVQKRNSKTRVAGWIILMLKLPTWMQEWSKILIKMKKENITIRKARGIRLFSSNRKICWQHKMINLIESMMLWAWSDMKMKTLLVKWRDKIKCLIK